MQVRLDIWKAAFPCRLGHDWTFCARGERVGRLHGAESPQGH